MIRHQLPAYSPLSLRAILGGTLASLRTESEAPARLAAQLQREYVAEQVVLCGSGTQALQLALDAAMTAVEPGAMVALPAFSCFDVVSAAAGARCRVAFYDLDPETLAPDVVSLECAFREGARVAVIAPLYGIPVPWDDLEACARRYGGLLIEDAAQGHGATWRDRRLGSLGRLSVLSFGRGKGWSGGAGGAVLFRDGLKPPSTQLLPARPAATAKVLASTSAQWAFGRPTLYGLALKLPGLRLGETVYRPPNIPSELPGVVAALLLAMWPAAEVEGARRRERARKIMELPFPPGMQTIAIGPAARPGFLRFPVRVDGGMRAFVDPRAAIRAGIAPSYPTTLDRLPAATPLRASGRGARYPGAETLARSLVTLPTHSLIGTAHCSLFLASRDRRRQELLAFDRASRTSIAAEGFKIEQPVGVEIPLVVRDRIVPVEGCVRGRDDVGP